ncbi:nuclear transport factor 2 family protein [Actinokineospora iranica]|uniref:Mce-associated membrane protein n=1 Tax=Actinokineospora iranica TaxID=1271860 RepID=A0A1G6YTN8_9PSEU|nr:nuclear transport factor 2 family protein [Actinokineospora iranica]SDD92916.1 Mce-associated membrane protein [Actinokineospora iranica]
MRTGRPDTTARGGRRPVVAGRAARRAAQEASRAEQHPTAAPDATPEPDEQTPAGDAGTEQAPPRGRPVLALVLLALALLLAGAGVWMTIRADQVRDAASDNTALVDIAATAEVSTAVRDGLEKIFSYKFDDTVVTELAARDLLTGEASAQYVRLFQQVREQAPAQKLVLRSKVVISGVSVLDGDRATLLVFLDQSATRGDTGEPTSGGAQLSVTAEKDDGRWKISQLIPR